MHDRARLLYPLVDSHLSRIPRTTNNERTIKVGRKLNNERARMCAETEGKGTNGRATIYVALRTVFKIDPVFRKIAENSLTRHRVRAPFLSA